jgi:hypothetical protein
VCRSKRRMEVEWNLLFAKGEFEVKQSVTLICRGSARKTNFTTNGRPGFTWGLWDDARLLAPESLRPLQELQGARIMMARELLDVVGVPLPGLSPQQDGETAYLQH